MSTLVCKVSGSLLRFRVAFKRLQATTNQLMRSHSVVTTRSQHGKIMEDKLYCGICKQIMEEPRILSCLHTFCTKCLIAKKFVSSGYTSRHTSIQEEGPLMFPLLTDRRKSSFAFSTLDSEAATVTEYDEAMPKIVCPSCECETLLTNSGVISLPLNYLLMNKIAVFKNQRPPCETCSSSTPAFCRCEQCDIAMCALCMDSHTKFRDTALHNLVNLNTTPVLIKPLCSHHLQELGFFCVGCTELICFTCCSTLHSSHRYEVAVKAAENYVTALGQALDHAKPVFTEMEKGANRIRSLHSKISIRCSRVEKEINSFYTTYKEALEAHHHSILAELEKIRDRRLILLNDYQMGLKDKLRGSQTAIDYTEELLQDSSPVELLNFAPILLNKLDVSSFTASDISVVTSKVSEFLQFLPDEKASSSNDAPFQLFGIISTQSLSPQNCTLQTEGLFTCRQHKRATFTLTTRDCENELLTHGGEKIETELKYKDATQKELPITITDEGEGTYLLSFTPDVAGSLSWSIWIRNTPIQGSPFTVCVSSLRPHKGVYHCCAFCSSKGNKTITCGCGSQMPGGYKGCGHGHEGHPGRRHWSCCGNVLHNSECGRPNSFYNF